MSNDGSATPEPGQQPDTSSRPAPSTGGEQPAAPAPSGYEAPSSSDWPTAPYGTRSTGDQPTAAYGTPGAPGAEPPTSPYGVPSADQPTAAYGTPATGQTGEQPAAAGYPAPAGTPAGGYGQPGYAQPGYPQPGQPQGGYPGGGYPPAGGTPYPYSPGQYPGPQAPGTDGVSIAALITGIIGMSVVAIVLGVLGLKRTKKNGTQGRGLAIAGLVLGGLWLLVSIGVGVAIAAAVVSHDNALDDLRADCTSGVMQACDDLYYESEVGSDDEEFGRTCGGRTEGYDSCVGLDESGQPTDEDAAEGASTGGSYGDDPELDALWDSCEAGSGTACDDLYTYSPADSEYEDFAMTCGNRVDFAIYCSDEIGG
ncbi:DUF4190 domain-containing protein [Cellulomonas sp. Marseille-Q8402]